MVIRSVVWNWKPITEKPVRGQPILMMGWSGYQPPHEIEIISGYYDEEFRPKQPWLTNSGDSAISHFGDGMLTHWSYVTSDMLPSSIERTHI